MNTITKTFQDDTELHLIADETHEFLLTTKEVALGYAVSTETIRQHKKRNADELIEGKHFLTVTKSHALKYGITLHSKANGLTLWTKRGLVRLGFFIKSARAKKFRDWCEDMVLKQPQPSTQHSHVLPLDGNHRIFYDRYGLLNPTKEFYIEHEKTRAKAYGCKSFGFLISSTELARLLGVSATTIRVLKNYHASKLKMGQHYIKFSTSQNLWWTREGAGWMALHSGDGSFGVYLLGGGLDKEIEMNILTLQHNSLQMIERSKELDPAAQEEV